MTNSSGACRSKAPSSLPRYWFPGGVFWAFWGACGSSPSFQHHLGKLWGFSVRQRVSASIHPSMHRSWALTRTRAHTHGRTDARTRTCMCKHARINVYVCRCATTCENLHACMSTTMSLIERYRFKRKPTDSKTP